MLKQTKRKIVVVVGSGFSTSLTSGNAPLVGNRTIPTLAELGDAMLTHINEITDDVPFPRDVIDAVRQLLERNQQLDENERFDFEQLMSLTAIKGNFSMDSETGPQRMKDAIRCLIYLIPSLFAQHLSIDGKLRKNRNLFYAIRDEARVKRIQEYIRRLVDENEVTFISFNYDGLIEAFSGLRSRPKWTRQATHLSLPSRNLARVSHVNA